MRRIAGVVWALGWGLLSALFGWLWRQGYWRWRGCFNEEGRCFDPLTATVHHEQAGVWLYPALACAAAALLGVVVAVWPRAPGRAARGGGVVTEAPDPALSPRLRAKISKMFAPHDAETAASVLAGEESGSERVRCAILKLSGGSLEKLTNAVRAADKDWRDVLMAAGFGADLTAHEAWLSE